MSSYGCQQHLINPCPDLAAILEFLCSASAKLANCGTYYARQLYFKAGKIPRKYDLHKLLKNNSHFQAMYSHVAQQCLTTVAESFKSYIGLLKGMKKGTVEQRPKLPGYRQGGLALVTYPKADVKLKDGLLRFPLGSKVKTWFGLEAFYLPMPSNLKFADIKEFRILPRNKCFYIEYVYKQPDVAVPNLDKSVETEESYTSKASFLDNDVLPKFREKPEGWQSSGTRVKRGLYRTAKNILLNADANGAANILAKVAIKLGLNLSGISRVSLIAPLKIRLWTLQESPGL